MSKAFYHRVNNYPVNRLLTITLICSHYFTAFHFRSCIFGRHQLATFYFCFMRKHWLILTCLLLPFILFAQNDKWDLQRCVDYAVQNNISVKQSDVQARIAALQTKLSKGASIPNLNFNTQVGGQFGRNIDPTSNQFVNNNLFFQSYSLQTNITLFNWFNVRNQIKAALANEEAGRLDIARVKNDISLNVVAAYLQLLLASEQVNIARAQIALSDSQRIITRKQVDAGSMPELNAAQIESQLALDSSTYITAVSSVQQNKLQLIAILNLDARQPFEVSIPDVDKIPLPPLSELDPAELFAIATNTQPQQQVDSLRIISGQYSIKAARGAMYPTVTAFGSLGSNYSNGYKLYNQSLVNSRTDSIAYTTVNGGKYPVFATSPVYATTTTKIGYWRQISDLQFGQSVGIQLNVPIFNGRQLRTNYERAKLNVESSKLQLALDNQTLQQNIYTARTNAEAAIQKFYSNKKAAAYAEYANGLSRKRYEIGMLSTSDYLIVQNNLATARFNLAASRYDYIFRIKLLEYYKFGAVQL